MGKDKLMAVGIESTFLLAYLGLVVTEVAVRVFFSVPESVLPGLMTLLCGLILAPLTYARWVWYARRVPTGALRSPGGWRCIPVGWGVYIRLWLRLGLAAGVLLFPATLVLAWGEWLFPANTSPVAWLVYPFGLLLLGVGLFLLRVFSLRYAAAPLLAAKGIPPGATFPLSARRMKGHRWAYLRFLLDWLPKRLLCLLVIPAIWILPEFHRRQTAFLLPLAVLS